MKYSPLRYPGGKEFLAPFIEEVLSINGMENYAYAEPYSGDLVLD
ncbi:hypothetical protein [Rhizosphaericola mali]|nr:hypothetical protein [Rhizosphaericola mali]